jgi:uncharacterized membrane protein
MSEEIAPRIDLGETSSGMQPRVAALLAYVFGLVSGLIVLVTERQNDFVRFHALQSITFSLAMFVLGMAVSFVPGIGWIAGFLLNLAAFGVWLLCMAKAFQGQWFRLPVVGEIAERRVQASSSHQPA